MSSEVSLYLRVLRLGFFQDGDVRIGVFPDGEEVLVGALGFRVVSRQSVGPAQLQARQCPSGEVHNDATMIEKFLKLGCGGAAVVCKQVSLAAQLSWVKCS